MNLDLTEIKKKIFTAIKITKKSRNFDRKPDRDWQVMLMVALIGMVLISGFGYLYFENIRTDKAFVIADDQSQVSTIDRDNLQKVNAIYDLRDEEMKKILQNGTGIVDPSR